jgi:hypothetical protein
VYKHILIDATLKTGSRGQNTAGWKKAIKEANVRNGLLCHLRRRREEEEEEEA